MTHNSMCASARFSTCRCSCGGALHGGSGGYSFSSGSDSSLSWPLENLGSQSIAQIVKEKSQDHKISNHTEKENTTRKSEESSLGALLNKVKQSTLEGIIIGAACAAVPSSAALIVPLYKMYQIGKAGVEVYDAYKNTKGTEEDKANAGIAEVSKQGLKLIAGGVVGKMVEPAAQEVADSVVSTAEKLGVVNQISQATKVDLPVFAEMLRGSIKGALTEGTSELISSMTVEEK